jgi:uncharacterized protein (TIGR02145 family)
MFKFFNKISVLVAFVVLIISSCSKDNDDSGLNSTNGKTTAVFNSNVTYGKMTDQDGNVYKTVTIGSQTWMAENLRTTMYNDGTSIPYVPGVSGSKNVSTLGGYCNYNYATSSDTIATYGRLYNWYAINGCKLCPSGWHVPTDAEWSTLTDYLGGESVAGGKIKEIGTTHWTSPNTGATNETGFTALPGGILINETGMFEYIGRTNYWWSDTEIDNIHARFRSVNYNYSDVYRYYTKKEDWLSVRCVKD